MIPNAEAMTLPPTAVGADPDPNTTPDIEASITAPSRKGNKQKSSKRLQHYRLDLTLTVTKNKT